MASSGQPEQGLSVQEDSKSLVSTDQSHEWDEARLEEAMARLQDMYKQVSQPSTSSRTKHRILMSLYRSENYEVQYRDFWSH